MTPLEAVCDIIQNELGLAPGSVVLWNQKWMMPKTPGLYVVVQVLSSKPFGNTRRMVGEIAQQSLNIMATLSIDLFSRNTEALDRKEEVVMALRSVYAQQKQEELGFYLASLPSAFVALNQEDGAAIPYRFNISVNVQYSVKKTQSTAYYDDFGTVSIETDP